MHVLVVGASRGSGREVVRALTEAGHQVTAFARSATRAELAGGDVTAIDGDVTDAEAVEKAVIGKDAVIVTLGISDNALRVRLTRRASTAYDVRSAGTRHVVAAMQRHGVRRLVVQTAYGIGESYARMPLAMKAFFVLVLRPQIQDSERQESVVRASGLDWTLIRPVNLTDDVDDAPAHVDTADGYRGMKVSRRQVARVATGSLLDPGTLGETLSVSG